VRPSADAQLSPPPAPAGAAGARRGRRLLDERTPPLTPAQAEAAARQVVDHAAAIIDGEVIRPFVPGQSPALVRVHRRFKGPAQAEYEVGILTSCDVPLVRLGERARMILTGGPDVYFIHMGMGVSASEAAAIDRLLGSDPARDWPYVQGAVVP
jgi:hypothetical protein